MRPCAYYNTLVNLMNLKVRCMRHAMSHRPMSEECHYWLAHYLKVDCFQRAFVKKGEWRF